jgi:hypothetical protein
MPEELKPKTEKQIKLEGMKVEASTAWNIMDRIGKVMKADADFDIIKDDLGHYFTHQTNIDGEFGVMTQQILRLIAKCEAERIIKPAGWTPL